ncbi:MAG: hypothetical protein BA862_01425 [Desulfobulbaceae bacterium S3730MH12]|nr:MAG: hypothetical protein BA862_01425 [Desulfobulbaceae bacterium S3730MH12]
MRFLLFKEGQKKSMRGWWIIRSVNMVLGGCPGIVIVFSNQGIEKKDILGQAPRLFPMLNIWRKYV